MNCTAKNATTRHFAVRPGDILPCGHAAARATDGSLVCSAPTAKVPSIQVLMATHEERHATPELNVAYTHPVEAYRGNRSETTVHSLKNRLGDTVQYGCGVLATLHEAPHGPDGVRLTEAPVTCRSCKSA